MRGWSLLPGGLFVTMVLLAGCTPKRLAPLEPVLDQGVKRPADTGPVVVDVGLAEGLETLRLSLDGPAVLLEGQSRRPLFTFPEGGGELEVRRQSHSVRWNAGMGWSEQPNIVLQPLDPDQRLTYDEMDFRGDFLIIPSPRNPGLTLINQVGLGMYLYGVVPWEIGRHGPEKMAALQAQTVAARTYTISHLGSRRSLGFDVYSSVMDQVYKGSRHEDALCNEAVDGTRGVILMSGDDLVDAYYSACCGGHSSQIENVWPREPVSYLRHHPDRKRGDKAFCAESRHYHWEEEWSLEQLEDILQRSLPAYVEYMSDEARKDWAGIVFRPRGASSSAQAPGRLLDIVINSRTPSGRVGTMTMEMEAGAYLVRGDRTRWVLPPASGKPFILRSAKFELDLLRDGDRLQSIKARGQGYGHGIGLCQTGALAMADQGFSYQDILKHYYFGCSVGRR